MDKVLYHLPGAFEYFNVYKVLIPLFFNERKKFYDFADLYCVYGSPAFFPWNGGRSGHPLDKYAHYKEVDKFYKSYNIAMSITATNLLITETDLHNKYCNEVLEYYNKPGNSVIISNELLHEYVKEKYKNYLLISSTTKCLTAEETIKEYEKYDIVVLDYNLNNNWDFLNNLSQQQKSKSEFLINHACNIKCPRRKSHYIRISKVNLFNDYKESENFNCMWPSISFLDSMKRPFIITVDRIQKEYLPKGFTHFKIEGRNQRSINLIFNLIHYLVKPEYHEEILYKTLTSTIYQYNYLF